MPRHPVIHHAPGVVKRFTSSSVATYRIAVSGPTPGAVLKRGQISPPRRSRAACPPCSSAEPGDIAWAETAAAIRASSGARGG